VRDRPRAFDRDLALQQAVRLFWIKGYEATSIADLTEVMGIGTKSLYAAFKSKDALNAEALALYSRTFETLVLGRFRQATTAREAVQAFLLDSACAMTGSDSKLPHGCMVNLGFVGGDGHGELSALMIAAREAPFNILEAAFGERSTTEICRLPSTCRSLPDLYKPFRAIWRYARVKERRVPNLRMLPTSPLLDGTE
jgi:AcrR family transcriptional regulator